MPTISGITRNSVGAIASKFVRVYRRDSGALVAETYSDPTTGAYSVPTADTSEHYIIMHDGSGDPHWGETVLACHFNGSNGSTTFTDEKGHTLTANGGAQISTAQSKFGGASLYLDGSGDSVSAATSADWAIGTGDYTVEFWIYTADTVFGAVSVGVSGGLTIGYNIDNGSQGWGVWRTGIGADMVSGVQMSYSAWHHIAVTRASNMTRIFVDGTQVGSTTSVTTNYGQGALYVGKDGISSGFDFAGYIDDLRITKGLARYTANFTPPAIPFVDESLGGTENALIFDRVIPV